MAHFPASVRAARARIRAHRRFRWLALVVVAGGMMLSVVNISIVNIALPQMAADLGVDVTAIEWVVIAFLVTQATLLPVAGRAGDLYGRRRVFVAGVVVLILASIACAFAWDAGSLIAFRVVQGVGACAMAPTAFAYAAELFPPAERGHAMGVMGGVIGLAPVLALNVAGGLVGALGWRSVFWFSPALGLVVLAGAALVLPESRRAVARQPFDLLGAALAAVGLFSLLTALSRGEVWGWTSPATLGTGVVGIVGLAAFAGHEARTRAPMLALGLFRLRSLATANLAGAAGAAALFGTLILLPFELTTVLGFGAEELGLAITPIALSFVVVAPLAGRALGRVGSDRMATAGYGLATAGALGIGLAAPAQSYAAMLPGIVALGVGLAMSQSPVTTTAIRDVPASHLGVASALPNICRYTGGALGTAVLGTVLYSQIPAAAAGADHRLDAPTRALVADGFRAALVAAAAFMAIAAAIASRMPRLAGAVRPDAGQAVAGAGPVATRVAE
jgi:EmrB/QacA subfamily drug resistance transporter